jgi:hypothetical protein
MSVPPIVHTDGKGERVIHENRDWALGIQQPAVWADE